MNFDRKSRAKTSRENRRLELKPKLMLKLKLRQRQRLRQRLLLKLKLYFLLFDVTWLLFAAAAAVDG